MNSSPGSAVSLEASPRALDVMAVRRDFPVLAQEVNGRPLVYLDNGATTQKPSTVIEAVDRYYRRDNANVHRGVHRLSQRATDAFELARAKVQGLVNAADVREVVFTRGTTEAINLVAQAYARPRLRPGDEVVVTEMEHHSNLVPWQMVCGQTGARLRVVPIDERGALLLDDYRALLNERTRLVAVAHLSNALGTVNPIKEMVDAAHRLDIPVVVDGAQAVARLPIDVQALGCDFYALSGHKIYGPTGIGALYGRLDHLQDMAPYQGGGEMILKVSLEASVYAPPPYKFEAGTPNIAGAVGLGAAIDYVRGLGIEAIAAHEAQLLDDATRQVAEIEGIRLIGTAPDKAGILSFVFEGVHAHDVGTIMDHEGIAIRAGHLCALPVMQRFGIPATARASFGLYNTREEVAQLIAGMHKVLEVMRP